MNFRKIIPAALIAITSVPQRALAAGGAMPWDQPLAALGEALTGPTAASLALIAGFAAVAALAFGSEMAGWVRGLLVLCLGMSVLVAIPTLAAALGIQVGGIIG